MPVIVKRWFPDKVGSMTGLYSMALALGTSAAAAVTVPMTDALGGNWQSGLVVWAGLAAAAVGPWILLARARGAESPTGDRGPAGAVSAGDRRSVAAESTRAGDRESAASDAARTGDRGSVASGTGRIRDLAPAAATAARTGDLGPAGPVVTGPVVTRHEPDGLRITRSRTAWALAVFFGLQATAAYITMGWMAQIFRDAGVAAGTAGLLLAVTMVMGVPLAFVIPRLATRLPHQGPIVVALGLCGLAGYAGLYLAPAAGAWAWALLLGVSNCAFPLALTMVGMRARTGAGVVKLSAFAQSTGYLISIPGPLLVGVLYQHSGGWGLPLAMMAGLMVPQIGVGILAGRNRTVEDEAAR
jgi:CP family cyanate transporter-like MFS transporter